MKTWNRPWRFGCGLIVTWRPDGICSQIFKTSFYNTDVVHIQLAAFRLIGEVPSRSIFVLYWNDSYQTTTKYDVFEGLCVSARWNLFLDLMPRTYGLNFSYLQISSIRSKCNKERNRESEEKKKWTKIKEKKERWHSGEGKNTEMQETSLYSSVELCSPDRYWQQSFQDSFHREG